jgi:hypothetical protein
LVDLGIGINVSICEIVNCKGYSGGSNGIKGSIVNIFSSLGYSEQGNGIYLLSSNADSCTGISLSVVEDLPIERKLSWYGCYNYRIN